MVAARARQGLLMAVAMHQNMADGLSELQIERRLANEKVLEQDDLLGHAPALRIVN